MRILIADDSPVIRHMALTLLAREGHDVVLAEDGQRAAGHVQEQAFDLVLLDIHLADLDGFAATRTIRGLSGATARVPIIALTDDPSPGLERQCRSVGMDGCLGKPVTRTQLLHLVDGWSQRTSRCAAAPCQPGGAPAEIILSPLPGLSPRGQETAPVRASGAATGQTRTEQIIATQAILWLGDPARLLAEADTPNTLSAQLAARHCRLTPCPSAITALRLLAEAAEQASPYMALVVAGAPPDMSAPALVRLVQRFHCLGVAQVLLYDTQAASQSLAPDLASLSVTCTTDLMARLLPACPASGPPASELGTEADDFQNNTADSNASDSGGFDSNAFEEAGYDPFDLGDAFDDEADAEDPLAWTEATLFDLSQQDALRDALGEAELAEMLGQLGEQLAAFLAEIRELLARNERVAAGDVAHTLKGVAGNMGAQRVFIGARTLMGLLRAEETEIDPELCTALLAALDTAVEVTAVEVTAAALATETGAPPVPT